MYCLHHSTLCRKAQLEYIPWDGCMEIVSIMLPGESAQDNHSSAPNSVPPCSKSLVQSSQKCTDKFWIVENVNGMVYLKIQGHNAANPRQWNMPIPSAEAWYAEQHRVSYDLDESNSQKKRCVHDAYNTSGLLSGSDD